jgi:hypothetical protein
MRNALLAVLICAFLSATHAVSGQEKSQAEAPAPAASPSPPPRLADLDKSKIIYVADFDAAAAATPGARAVDGPVDSGSTASPRLNGTDAALSASAGQRVPRMMSDALVHDLRKAGYKTKLLGASEARPEDGMLISGVFVQAGKDGHLRRASLGAGDRTTDILIHATTTNLFHVAKPLYAAGADNSITLNPDVAVLKFNLGKDLSDKAIKKAAEQVVTELQRISLQAESEGLGGSSDPLNKFSKP